MGDVTAVEMVEVEKCDLGCSSAAETVGRMRRGTGMRGLCESSGNWGSGLEVSVAGRMRGAGERKPEGGGES